MIELLSQGQKNARSSRELSNVTGLTVREVADAIRRERLAGKPICSCSHGYYLPDDITDLKSTIKRLYKKANETRRVADAMKQTTTRGQL